MEMSAPRLLLEVLSGPCRGARAPLGRAVCIIGDDDGCDLLLGPPRSSGEGSRYASLRADADGVWLARPESDGASAAETWLAPGDDFEVADVRCRVVYEPGAPALDDGASTSHATSPDDAWSSADTTRPTDAASPGAARGQNANDMAPGDAAGSLDREETGSLGGEEAGSLDREGAGSLGGQAADFAAALDRALAATPTGRAPAGAPRDGAWSAASIAEDAVRPARARLRRRAALSSLVLIAGLLIGGALTDGPLFAMQGRNAPPAESSGAASALAASALAASTPAAMQQAADALQTQLARAGVARWVGVVREGAALHLMVFADAPAHESAIRQALANAGVALPVRVMNEAAVLAQVNAFLQGNSPAVDDASSAAQPAPAAQQRPHRLRAVGAGPGRIRLVGLVDSRADATAVLADLRERFTALKAIECDLASDADARQIVLPLLREPLLDAGPDGVPPVVVAAASGGVPVDQAFADEGAGVRLLIDAAPAVLAAIGQRVAAAAAAQNQVLAVALPRPDMPGHDGPAPRMIVMGPRPYAVLADGVTVFEGDALGDRVVARIERDAIRLLPPPSGST
ncbi:MAG: hypothetical protein ACRYHA_34535 [Janthinobacterium lividum]